MTPEKQSYSPEEKRKMMRTVMAIVRNTALHHFEHIDLRTLRVLQDLDLFDDEAPPVAEGVELSVLRDQKHTRRRSLPDGPLVLYLTDSGKPTLRVVDLTMLFFSDDQGVRQTALYCMETMREKDPMAFTPNTATILKKNRVALISKAPEKWRPAAVSTFDALHDDIFIALHGVRQCLENKPVIENSLNIYTPKVINPTVTSVDSISLPIGQPERDHEALAQRISEVVDCSSNIAELCGMYLTDLGYLPLASSYSLATAVSMWLSSNSSVDPWQEIWEWANTEKTPISRYHACSVFVLFPELIPEGKLPDLWNEVLRVVQGANRSGADCELWELRRDLARHYSYHFEARLPESDGASICCIAWWLAEQVASLFPADAYSAKFYRDNWVKPALDRSSRIWLAASAQVQRSFLRYVTFSVQSPWAVALLTLMGDHLDELAPTGQAKDIQERFSQALLANMFYSLPFPIKTPDDPTFALECSLANTVLKWSEYQAEDHRKVFQELFLRNLKLLNKDGLCYALRNIEGFDLPFQVAVCIALKAKVYTDPSVVEGVWEVISEVEWRKSPLGGVNPQVQDLLIDSLSLLFLENPGKWMSHLPQYIAELCENEKDTERRRTLFLFTIYISLASDTVGAVHRLLRGDQKETFVEYVKEYREQAEAMRSEYPPWVAGKLRSLMASLYIM